MSKIAKEVAESEFDRFIAENCIAVSTDKEELASFNEQRSRVVSAIERGDLVISEKGQATYTPRRTDSASPITFNEPTGASLMAMDRKKAGEDISKLYATMADMSGETSKTFANMKMADLKVCMAVVTLFLA
ncbi:MAG: hypothetical protein U5M23_01285 [Marinagarivorans sp.]|nr:hypothetical protein [Marinagarivorans sp.]